MTTAPAVLSFDVVGTLIDFETGMLSYLRQACARALEHVDDDTFLAAYRTSRKNPRSSGSRMTSCVSTSSLPRNSGCRWIGPSPTVSAHR